MIVLSQEQPSIPSEPRKMYTIVPFHHMHFMNQCRLTIIMVSSLPYWKATTTNGRWGRAQKIGGIRSLVKSHVSSILTLRKNQWKISLYPIKGRRGWAPVSLPFSARMLRSYLKNCLSRSWRASKFLIMWTPSEHISQHQLTAMSCVPKLSRRLLRKTILNMLSSLLAESLPLKWREHKQIRDTSRRKSNFSAKFWRRFANI